MYDTCHTMHQTCIANTLRNPSIIQVRYIPCNALHMRYKHIKQPIHNTFMIHAIQYSNVLVSHVADVLFEQNERVQTNKITYTRQGQVHNPLPNHIINRENYRKRTRKNEEETYIKEH